MSHDVSSRCFFFTLLQSFLTIHSLSKQFRQSWFSCVPLMQVLQIFRFCGDSLEASSNLHSEQQLASVPPRMSLKWGALALAILDSLIQIFAAFYLHFVDYKVLAYFGLTMAVVDTIVIFSFPSQRKVFLCVLQGWQVLILLYGGYLVSQWFYDPLIVSFCESPFFEGVQLQPPCDSYHMNLGFFFGVILWGFSLGFFFGVLGPWN